MARLSTLLPLLLLGTAGCSTLSGNVHGDWACSAPGGTCAPMSTIDQQAILSIGAEPPQMRNMDVPGPRTPADPLLAGFAAGSSPSRTPERTLRIVFPAFVDKAGLYFEPAAVHAVVATPNWSSVPERLASLSRAPGSTASAAARSAVPGSALATMDEVVAVRAARRPMSVLVTPEPAVTPPPAPEAAAVPVFEREAPEPGPAAASFPDNATVTGSIDPSRVPPAAVVAGPALASPAAGVLPISPSAVSPADASGSPRPAPTAAAPGPKSVVDPKAPYGYRTVVWKGKRYQLPRKSPAPVLAPSPAEQESAAAVRALNRAALQAAAQPSQATRPTEAPATQPPTVSADVVASAGGGDQQQ